MTAPKILFIFVIATGILAPFQAVAQIQLTGVNRQFAVCSGTASGGSGTINCTITRREIIPVPLPAIVTVHELGAGNDTISVSEACVPNAFQCDDIGADVCTAPYNQLGSPGEPCTSNSTVTPSQDIEIRLRDQGFYTNGVVAPFTTGTYTFTVTDQHSGSYSVVLTFNITSITQPVVVYPGGSVTGCSGSLYPTSIYSSPVTCSNPSNLNPTGAATVAPPALGGSYVDGNFATTVHMDMPFQASTSANGGTNDVDGQCDAILSCTNADGTLGYTGGFTPWTNGNAYLTYLHKSGKTGRLSVTAATGGMDTWSAVYPYRYYTTNNGLSIHQIDLNSNPPASCQTAWSASCGTDTVIYTEARANAVAISGGHDGQASKDDWWGYLIQRSVGEPLVCIINLLNTAQNYCTAWPTEWQGHGYIQRNAALSPGWSTVTGNRYMIVGPAGGTGTWGTFAPAAYYTFNVNTNTLSYLGMAPMEPGPWGGSGTRWASGPACDTNSLANIACVQSGHSAMGEGCSGGVCKEFYIRGKKDTNMNSLTLTAFDLDKWPNLEIPAEVSVNGGSYPGYISGGDLDFHGGCNTRGGICLAGTTGLAITQARTYTIGSMTASGVTPVHIVENAGDSTQFNGACSSVVFGGVMGNTVLDGQAWTISNFAAGPPASFDIAAATGNGTWVSGTGLFTCNTPLASLAGQEEIIGIDLNYLVGHGNQMRVLRIARTMQLYPSTTNGNMLQYYNQTHQNVSGDGTVVMWATNMGIPEQSSIVSADTGFSLLPPNSILGSMSTIGPSIIQ